MHSWEAKSAKPSLRSLRPRADFERVLSYNDIMTHKRDSQETYIAIRILRIIRETQPHGTKCIEEALQRHYGLTGVRIWYRCLLTSSRRYRRYRLSGPSNTFEKTSGCDFRFATCTANFVVTLYSTSSPFVQRIPGFLKVTLFFRYIQTHFCYRAAPACSYSS